MAEAGVWSVDSLTDPFTIMIHGQCVIVPGSSNRWQ